MRWTASVEQGQTFQVESSANAWFINQTEIQPEISGSAESGFSVKTGNRYYAVFVKKVDTENQLVQLMINQKPVTVKLTSELDELLKSLGMGSANTKKVKDLKAPMPGLVRKILVSVGDSVQKGDSLLVLEAMKMENILKSPADGVIGSIPIKEGQAIEKNQTLIGFQ